MLVKIFMLIPLPDLIRGISPLCRRLRDICHLPFLWRHFKYDLFYNKWRFDHIFEHAEYFHSLQFTYDMGKLKMEMTTGYIEEGLSRCTQLLELDISYNLSIRNLNFILKMPKLEILNMEYCCNVDPVTAVTALKTMQKPWRVILSLCEQFSEDQLCRLFLSSSSYEHIDVEKCSCLSVKSVRSVLAANPNIKSLMFSPSWGPPPRWMKLIG